MGTAYVIGEHAADLIKAAHGAHDAYEQAPQIPLHAMDGVEIVRKRAVEAIAGARLRVAAVESLREKTGDVSASLHHEL